MKKIKLKKSTFFSDFKAFITKGNIVDLAVAVIIGSAFSTIVNSLVNDIIMPLLNLATGDGVQGLSLVLNGVDKYLADGSVNPEAVLWTYGNFLQAIINFLVVALCIFTALRIMTKLKDAGSALLKKEQQAIQKKLKKGEITAEEAEKAVAEAETKAEEAAAPAEPVETTEDILRQIRDELKRLNADKAEVKEEVEE